MDFSLLINIVLLFCSERIILKENNRYKLQFLFLYPLIDISVILCLYFYHTHYFGKNRRARIITIEGIYKQRSG